MVALFGSSAAPDGFSLVIPAVDRCETAHCTLQAGDRSNGLRFCQRPRLVTIRYLSRERQRSQQRRAPDQELVATAEPHGRGRDRRDAEGLEPYEQVVEGRQNSPAVVRQIADDVPQISHRQRIADAMQLSARQIGDDVPQISHRQGRQRGDEQGVVLVLHRG
ncbi:MAG: hypothetical protein ACREJ5_11165 [Geminicoccaceae bacterium]